MDNAYLEIENREIEIHIDNGGGIEGFSADGVMIDMGKDSMASSFIHEHMVVLQEEAAYKITEWERTHIMNRAYWGDG